MTAEQARRRFAEARVARLATVGSAAQPHLVPIVFALAEETIYSVVDAKPKRTAELERLRNVRANPRACVLVDHYEDDWSALWWVRADGLARVIERGEPEARLAVQLLAGRYPEQRAVGSVLALDVQRWSHWAGS
ncbi:MAG: TIGR03668 family PPOX class F420-dependent oxidoreductase [Solirubrobacteraceae bacterium]